MVAKFSVGDTVIVSSREHTGHVRTPYYIRGHTGVVERICGTFGNPETLAYGGDGRPKQPLYRVRFDQSTIWPDHGGADMDTVDIEIYEHWLEPGGPRP